MSDAERGSDLETSYLFLNGAEAKRVEVGPDFWQTLDSHDEVAGRNLLPGAVDLVLDEPGGERIVALRGRDATIVPRGVWHAADAHVPSEALHVTRGEGTRHREGQRATGCGGSHRKSARGRLLGPARRGMPGTSDAALAGMRMRAPTALWLLIGIGLGCAGDPAERVRSVTYPPDLQYIDRQEIETAMRALARELRALDRELDDAGGVRRPEPARVVEILSRMDRLVAKMKHREHSTHPRIDAYAPMLRRDIERALVGARSEPPSYYAAGRISGGCAYCHAPPGVPPGAADGG